MVGSDAMGSWTGSRGKTMTGSLAGSPAGKAAFLGNSSDLPVGSSRFPFSFLDVSLLSMLHILRPQNQFVYVTILQEESCMRLRNAPPSLARLSIPLFAQIRE